MEETRKKLTIKERAILSNLVEDTDTMRALKNLLAHRQLMMAETVLAAAPNWEFVLKNRGAMEEDIWILTFLLKNHKAEQAKAN